MLLTAKQAAQVLPNSRSSIYRALHEGKLRGKKILYTWYIEEEDLLQAGAAACKSCGKLCQITENPCGEEKVRV